MPNRILYFILSTPKALSITFLSDECVKLNISFFTFWLRAVTVLWKMIFCFLVWCKITRTVWVAGVHQVKFVCTMMNCCQLPLTQMEMPQVERCLPDGGCENLWLHLSIALQNTLISCTDPGHPASTNVNLMSKSQQAMTFCVVMFLRHMCWTVKSLSTMTGT